MSQTFSCPFCEEKHVMENDITPVLFHCLGDFYLNIGACTREFQRRGYSFNEELIGWAKLAYYIVHKYLYYKREINHGIPSVDVVWVLDNVDLPTPTQQKDLLIEYVARNTHFLGQALDINHKDGYYQLKAWIGGVGPYAVQRLVQELGKEELLLPENTKFLNTFSLELTTRGWKCFENLQQVNRHSTQAFMAMKFDAEQMNFIKKNLVPAVKNIGFNLLLLTDINSKENLIDNKLRVAIKKSRFLVCDLTNCNAGAYWEAGYAEGLKIPVIYICERSAFLHEDLTKRPHFDVNHQEIFQWDKNNKTSIDEFLDNIQAKIQVMLG